MPKEQLKSKLIKLLTDKERVENEIEKLQNQLVQQLCPKGKQSCEPEYCALRMTETCPFLKKWRKILTEANVRNAAD